MESGLRTTKGYSSFSLLRLGTPSSLTLQEGCRTVTSVTPTQWALVSVSADTAPPSLRRAPLLERHFFPALILPTCWGAPGLQPGLLSLFYLPLPHNRPLCNAIRPGHGPALPAWVSSLPLHTLDLQKSLCNPAHPNQGTLSCTLAVLPTASLLVSPVSVHLTVMVPVGQNRCHFFC